MEFYYGKAHIPIDEVDVVTIMNSYIEDDNGDYITVDTIMEGFDDRVIDTCTYSFSVLRVIVEKPGIYRILYRERLCERLYSGLLINECECPFECFMELLKPRNNPKSANKV